MSKTKFVNIACGNVYIKNSNWINLDIVSENKYVKSKPSKNYLSQIIVLMQFIAHILEHIPLSKVPNFLEECFRILKKGGVLRLVLPDFEALSAEYLKQIKLKNYVKTKIVLLTIIDQV